MSYGTAELFCFTAEMAVLHFTAKALAAVKQQMQAMAVMGERVLYETARCFRVSVSGFRVLGLRV